LRLGVLGPEGTFSEKAARRWNPEADLVYFEDFEEILKAVESGSLDLGIVPIENSLEGAVPLVMDVLLELDVKITGETSLPVRHCLMSQGLGEIKVVVSHPQPLGQCRKFLKEHYPGVEIRATGSTSHAARLAQEFPGMAAIAGADTAEKYGLDILAMDIQDGMDNITRFAVVGREIPGPTGRDKTSLVVYLDRNRPGALCQVLQEFSLRSINMTRIESRPSKRGLGDYYFYIDLEGHISDGHVQGALVGIKRNAAEVKVLGSYPRA